MKETKGNFERLLEFTPAFDKRSDIPSKNYGIHGVEMRFVLKGGKGAVQFLLSTNWQLRKVRDEKPYDAQVPRFLLEPLPADLGYHSPVPHYNGQDCISGDCPYLDGKPCYYDGSGLSAQEPWDILVEEGEDALWQFLENYYDRVFTDAR